MARSPLALALVLAAAPQQESVTGLYPAVRHERVLRSYNLEGKLDRGKLEAAARDAGLEIVYGPVEASSRPQNSVVVVSALADDEPHDIEVALRQARVQVEELEVFLFEDRIEGGFPDFGIGIEKIDYMLGISGEIRWCDMVEGWTVFHCVAGRLDADELEGRFRKLQRGFGHEDATLGEVVRDRFTWTLPSEVDPARAKKLEKAIGKLAGVSAAAISGRELAVTLELAGLEVGGPPAGFRGEAPSRASPPRPTASTNPLLDLLAEEGLAPGSG
jgi:hypothetical protein